MKKFFLFIMLLILMAALWYGADTVSDQMRKESVPAAEAPLPPSVYVYVSGAVRRPGLYSFDRSLRVGEVVQAAGNALAYADVTAVNYAEEAKDGMHIHIPYDLNGIPAGGSESNGLVNINEADEKALINLSGIGPAMARRIIEYRMKNGMFTSVEELKKVKGIGEKKYEKLQDKVTV